MLIRLASPEELALVEPMFCEQTQRWLQILDKSAYDIAVAFENSIPIGATVFGIRQHGFDILMGEATELQACSEQVKSSDEQNRDLYLQLVTWVLQNCLRPGQTVGVLVQPWMTDAIDTVENYWKMTGTSRPDGALQYVTTFEQLQENGLI